MNHKLSVVLLSAFALFGFAREAQTSVTSTWTQENYTSFNKGESKSTYITSLGEVRPGWVHKSITLEFDNAWSSIRSSNGTTYIGTDDKATIYKIAGGKASSLAKIKGAVAIVSMALQGHNLYVGTMPAGEVWRVNTKSGKAKKLVSLEKTETVWSLKLAQGYLYAGTGPEGLLYKIDIKSGKATVAFDSDDKRIMSLATTKNKALWIGTSDKAILFRHDLKNGATRAVADFAGNEISALAENNGTIIAAVNDFAPGTSTGFKTKEAVDAAKKKKDAGQTAKMPKVGTKPGADKKDSATIEPIANKLRKGKGALYRVHGDGQMQQLQALTASTFTSVAVNQAGQIFAGAANKGKIYTVDTDQSVATAIDVDQRYIAQIHIDKKGKLSFVTGDAASLYQGASQAKTSQYLSTVFDAKSPSRFGKFSWHSQGSIKMETRTGNTEEPGTGWSAWQSLEKSSISIGNIVRAKVSSPPGRYFQYRATFSSDKNAVLKKTSLFYLPANKPTRITSATITSKEKSKGINSKELKPHSTALSIEWKKDNDDGDKTMYSISVRREGELHWRSIHTGNAPLIKEKFIWNTETFPDGFYRLRISANDSLDNSKSRALDSHWTSPIFSVDNQRPAIAGLSIQYPAASARATDALSNIRAVAYSVDDGPWQMGECQDQIFDDPSELLKMDLPTNLRKGLHTISIRVVDGSGNVSNASKQFDVK